MSRPSQLQILSENWVTKDCTFTVSTGSATALYLYDQKPRTQWQSEGSNDSTPETVVIAFYNRFGVACSRTIDRIILLNTNGKAISVSTTLGAITTAFGAATGSAANIIITGTPIEADSITITVSTTQNANEDKAIGEIKACLYLMTVNATTEHAREDEWRTGNFRTRSGALVRWREYAKYAGSETITNLTLEQRDILNAAIETYSFLTFVFYGAFDLAAIYELAITAAPTEKFDRLSMYYEIGLELKER